MFGKGISKAGDVLDLAVNIGVVNKSGAWFAYNDAKIGQGRENAKKYLLDNPAVMDEIEAKVRAHYGLNGAALPAAEEADSVTVTEDDGEFGEDL